MAAIPARSPPDRRIGFGLAAAATGLVVLIAVTVLLRSPGAPLPLLTISVTSSGGHWRLTVIATATSPSAGSVDFLTRRASGEAFSPLTALPALPNASFSDIDPVGVLSPGDAVVLPTSQFLAGLTYWFLQSDRLLAVGTLP